MDTRLRLAWLALVLIVLVPTAARAQASIAGAVRDTSGAVLPGVTVEASSPVLIEKVRVVTSDDAGQYRIVDLRPGVYTVTFTLPGFNVFRRDGIELTGSFIATVDAEMRVGALEETVTVTGEAPLVDVQSATRQRVMDREVLDTVPSGRTATTMGVLIPGVTAQTAGGAATQDVGGNSGDFTLGLSTHGGKQQDQVYMQGGNLTTAMAQSGYVSRIQVNFGGAEEIAIRYGRRRRRAGDRRRANQHPPAGRRQHIPGQRVRQLWQRLAAGQQLLAGAPGPGAAHARRRQAELRHQSGIRRPAQARQTLVLRLEPHQPHRQLCGRVIRQRQCEQPCPLDLCRRSERARLQPDLVQGRRAPSDLAGVAEEQARFLVRRAGQLPVPAERQRADVCRSRDAGRTDSAAEDCRRLHRAAHDAAAVRSGHGPPVRRERYACDDRLQPRNDFGGRAIERPAIPGGRPVPRQLQSELARPLRPVVHHGLARVQDGLESELGPERHQSLLSAAAELPVQQRRPQPAHDAGAELQRHACGTGWSVCAGHVDARSVDAALRRAVRHVHGLVSRAAPGPDSFHANPEYSAAGCRQRHELQGHHAAIWRLLRSVRHAQDRAQSDDEQVPFQSGGGRRPRERRQPGDCCRHQRDAQLDGCQPRLQAGLRPAELRGQWRMRGHQQQELRESGAGRRSTIPISCTGGDGGTTTGSSRPACSTSCSPACRST